MYSVSKRKIVIGLLVCVVFLLFEKYSTSLHYQAVGSSLQTELREAYARIKDLRSNHGGKLEYPGKHSLKCERINGGRRVLFFFGTRPEIIKMAPVIRLFRAKMKEGSLFRPLAVFTGQHVDLISPFERFWDITAGESSLHIADLLMRFSSSDKP